MLNLDNIKSSFPIFKKHPNLVYLDNAATTQKPEAVLRAMDSFYRESNSNIHRGVYPLAVEADLVYENGRKVVADFIGAPTEQIIFTKNATEGANMLAFGIGEALVGSGDNVVVTELEHHANFLPWQEMAKHRGAELRVWALVDILAGKIPDSLIDDRTKVVAVTQMSNVLGVQPDISKLVERAHSVDAKVVMDASQSIVHMPLNVADLSVDAAFFTGHKLFGPMGVGVLYMTDYLSSKIPPMLTGGGMIKEMPDQWLDCPAKFEAGTPNVAGVAGLSEAIKFVMDVGIENIDIHEAELVAECRRELGEIPEVKLWGDDNGTNHSSIVSFEIKGVHPHDIASILAEENVCIRAGHHCAKPLMKSMGVQAVARASFSVYNTLEDVQALIAGVKRAINVFK
jgi:cysteine desulfurase / selenocysteine lyase